MSQLKQLDDCAKWIDHSNTVSVANTSGTTFPASNVAGIGSLQANKQNFTRFVEVFNRDPNNIVYVSVYNQGETARPASVASRAVNVKTYRRFKVPQGSGQGIISVIAETANCNIAISWGIGAG